MYYNALLDVPNPENRLRIAMAAQLFLLTGEVSNTLLVPVQAVHNTGEDNQQVQAQTGDNRLETRRVKTGITDNVDIQILDGLTAGKSCSVAPVKPGP